MPFLSLLLEGHSCHYPVMNIIGSVFPESGGSRRQCLFDFGFKDSDARSLYHLNRLIIGGNKIIYNIGVIFFIKSIQFPIPGVIVFSTVEEQTNPSY